MSKQKIWSTGIIVAWTPAIYICPGWMWKAPPMFKIPAPPHHPGNLCCHLLWPTICRCYYRCWWFRMCCLIKCIWDRATLHEPEERSPVDWAWSHISNMYIFMLNLFNIAMNIDSISSSIQISLIIAESCKWSSKNLVWEPLKQLLGVWSSSRYTL